MHEGHRKRMRERFLKDGDFQNFAPHEVLELLLYSTIARGDTNPIGHALIDKFGTLANVFEASPEELKEVSGIGESSAFLLSLIPHLCQAYRHSKWNSRVFLGTTDLLGQYAIDLFIGKQQEEFHLLCVDSNKCLYYDGTIVKGTINEVPAYPRVIVAEALKRNAQYVYFLHNHPGGSSRPSRSDIEATKALNNALESIGVTLLDHVIVAGHGYYSMEEGGDLIAMSDF